MRGYGVIRRTVRLAQSPFSAAAIVVTLLIRVLD